MENIKIGSNTLRFEFHTDINPLHLSTRTHFTAYHTHTSYCMHRWNTFLCERMNGTGERGEHFHAERRTKCLHASTGDDNDVNVTADAFKDRKMLVSRSDVRNRSICKHRAIQNTSKSKTLSAFKWTKMVLTRAAHSHTFGKVHTYLVPHRNEVEINYVNRT